MLVRVNNKEESILSSKCLVVFTLEVLLVSPGLAHGSVLPGEPVNVEHLFEQIWVRVAMEKIKVLVLFLECAITYPHMHTHQLIIRNAFPCEPSLLSTMLLLL